MFKVESELCERRDDKGEDDEKSTSSCAFRICTIRVKCSSYTKPW